MFNSTLLEVLIAIVFVYLMLGLVVTALVEAVNAFFARRQAMLKKAIDKVFDDRLNKNYSEQLFEHPLIAKLKRNQNHPPSYISSSTFAMGFIDVISSEGKETTFYKTADGEIRFTEQINSNPYLAFKEGLDKMKERDLKRMLHVMFYNSKDYDSLKANIEKWFNDYMDRVSGWFKKEMRLWTRCIAVSVVLFTDAIEKYANFLSIGRQKTQTDVFELLRGHYHSYPTRFVVLTLDMDWAPGRPS